MSPWMSRQCSPSMIGEWKRFSPSAVSGDGNWSSFGGKSWITWGRRVWWWCRDYWRCWVSELGALGAPRGTYKRVRVLRSWRLFGFLHSLSTKGRSIFLLFFSTECSSSVQILNAGAVVVEIHYRVECGWGKWARWGQAQGVSQQEGIIVKPELSHLSYFQPSLTSRGDRRWHKNKLRIYVVCR